MAIDLEPITPEMLLTEIEALRNHYGEWADLDVPAAKRLHRDWLADFDGFPAKLVAIACSRWRKSPAKRPPAPGELIAQVKNELNQLRHLGWQAVKARKVLDGAA